MLKPFQVSWLSRAGGNNLSEATGRMLQKIMTDQTALNITYLGTAKKLAFQEMNVKDALYGE